MKRYLYFIFFFLSLHFGTYSNNLYGQTVLEILSESQHLVTQKKIKTAYSKIKPFALKHPESFDLQQYAAQLAYWNWDISAAKKFFRQAIVLHPDELSTGRDYAKMLVALGEYTQAIPLLKQYLQTDPMNEEAVLYYIKALYYKGDLSKAIHEINALPKVLKGSKSIISLKKEIVINAGFNLSLEVNYTSDDQPLMTLSPTVQISKSHSALLNWRVQGSSYNFDANQAHTNAYTAKIGNTTKLDQTHTSISADAGFSNLSMAQSTQFVGGIEVQQRILKHFFIELSATRKPYFFSSASTQTTVLYNSLQVAIALNNFYGITGKLQAEQQQFNDHNQINNYAGWLLSPGLKKLWINGKLGLSYQYANAHTNHYTPTITVDSFVANYDSSRTIPAKYIPYFTPQQQSILSFLLWLEIKPIKHLSFISSASYPLIASLENPYFFLNNGGNNTLYFEKSSSKQSFKPITLKADLRYHPSNRWEVGLGYEYLKNYFFEAHYFHLTMSLHGL
ncbi:MAG: tetratricopeptide repeat protein [Bacteroidetes bacterium]|nr:tetratricopeptide repeat protein [Bacteroidota bacterium]MBS1739760.1 tetratricopeptide repeat protein [Bacteroidota bacterium]